MVESRIAPLADLHLKQFRDKWKLSSCFRVMQKELAHLQLSVLHLTQNSNSASSQSLSGVSTEFFQLSLFIGDIFSDQPQPDIYPVFPHNLLGGNLSSLFLPSLSASSPPLLLLLCLPHRRWKAPLWWEIWNSNQVFGFLLDDLIFPIAMVLGGFHIMTYFCQGSKR